MKSEFQTKWNQQCITDDFEEPFHLCKVKLNSNRLPPYYPLSVDKVSAFKCSNRMNDCVNPVAHSGFIVCRSSDFELNLQAI